MERLGFELKLLGDDDEVKVNHAGQEIGVVHGLASTFKNVDRVGDVVMPGAFKDAKIGIPMLWQHDQKQPIGRITKLHETAKGLEFEAELVLAVPQAKSAYELLKAGVIQTTSIGYRVKRGGSDFVKMEDPETKKSRRVRRLKGIDLGEISLVTTPANPEAVIHGVKNDVGELLDAGEFETFLREAGGLSRSEAKCVVSKGYAHLLSEKRAGLEDEEAEREAGSDDSELHDDDAEREAGSESSTETTDSKQQDDTDAEAKAAREAALRAAQSLIDTKLGELSSLVGEMK